MVENELNLPAPGNIGAKRIEPEEAHIKISITTDTRQTGTKVLAEKIAEFLKKEGYTNVTPSIYQTPPWDENEEITAIQKRVNIAIDLPGHVAAWAIPTDAEQMK